jgi:hypothetical protein
LFVTAVAAASRSNLDDRTRALLQRAERRVFARDANAEIDRERGRNQLAHGRALSYEVVLQQRGFAYLAGVVAERLAGYLGDKGISPLACAGVFVSLFVGDELYFLAASEFFDAVGEAEGQDELAWRARLSAWGRR